MSKTRSTPNLSRRGLLKGAGLAISFSAAQAAEAEARACAAAGVALLMGTTGLGPPAQGALQEAALSIPVLIAANTSLGVALLEELAATACAPAGGSAAPTR